MLRVFAALMVALMLSACSSIQLASHVAKKVSPPSPPPPSVGTFKVGTPYTVMGQRYYPEENYELVETGIASWYGPGFHGKRTANGEIFDQNELTAAHRTLQMPSLVRVTNLENGRSLIVRINDRGPFKRGRIIDLSKRSAELLGFKNNGTAKVKVEVLTQESLRLAELAKSGATTRGYEVAANQGGVLNAQPPHPSERHEAAVYQTVSVQPTAYDPPPRVGQVTAEPLTAPAPARPIPGHMKDGAFYPDPVVIERPVSPTSIYVQVGSFTVADNAYRMRGKLKNHGAANVYEAVINGHQYFRVRLGPIENVTMADSLLDRLVREGHQQSIIIVE